MLEAIEGGAALVVRLLATEQISAGQDVCVAIPTRRSWGQTDAQLTEALRTLGVEVFDLEMRRNPLHPANVRALSTLVRWSRSWKPDVVHSHATVGGMVGRLAARRVGVPSVHTQHGVPFADVDGGWSSRAAKLFERGLRGSTGFVIAVSSSEAEVLRSVHPSDRIATIPNGIALGEEPPRPLPVRPMIVSVSRFVSPKDPILAVQVMAAARRQVPDARALLVGYGPLEDEVRAEIRRLDPGIEVRSDISGPDAIGHATVVLLCTRREGLPTVVLEAMERARPVVATDVVGCRDAVVHRETGMLFPLGDVGAGAAAVASYLTDRSRAERAGAAGRARVLEQFTSAAMAESVERLYASLTSSARPGWSAG